MKNNMNRMERKPNRINIEKTMQKIGKNVADRKIPAMILALAFAFASAFLIFGCYTPSPLYGTWVDNSGNTIRFQSDYTFSAKMKTSSGSEASQGTYSLHNNVITFDVENPSYTVVSEWDIRGSILYLTWKSSGDETLSLTLYLSAKSK